MENLFENHYTRTPELLKELYLHLYFRRPFSIALYGFFAVMAVAILIFDRGFIFNHLLYFAIVLAMQFFLYRKAVKMSVQRDKSKFDTNELLVQTHVTEDELHCQYGEDTTRTVALTDVKSAWKTKHLIVLRTKVRLVIILHKDNFTVGDYQDFLTHLRGHGIRV